MESAVLEALQAAFEGNKDAVLQLKEWQPQAGFHAALATLYSQRDGSCSAEHRMLAIAYFKTGVERYWRETAEQAISPDEKAFVRNSLLEAIREQNDTLARQFGHLVGMISRFDVPRAWPELVPQLVAEVQTDDALRQQRALLYLYRVEKALASRRLLPQRRVFADLATRLLPFLFPLLLSNTTTALSAVPTAESPETWEPLLQHTRLLIKAVRYLLAHGVQDLAEVEAELSIVNTVQSMLHSFTAAYLELTDSDTHPLNNVVEKSIIALVKLLRDLQTYHALSLVPHLPTLVPTLLDYILPQEAQQRRYPDKFLILCMLTVRDVLLCPKYKQSIRQTAGIEDPNVQRMHAAYQTLQACLHSQKTTDQDLQTAVLVQLMQHYLLTSDEEKEDWTTNEEEFAVADIGSSWEYMLKPCAEHLFQALLSYNTTELAPVVLGLLDQCHADSSLELRDATYNALALGAYSLSPRFDINPLIPMLLEQYASITSLAGDAGKLLQRRILLLFGQWQCINISSEPRPAIYSLLVATLLPDNDRVLQLTAAMTLERFAMDQAFEATDFSPLLGDAMTRLFQLLSDVEECATKLRVLSCITQLVNCMENEIMPYIGALVAYVPTLWEQSLEYPLLQTAVVRCAAQLLEAFKASTPELEVFCCQLIQYGADLTQTAHEYLCDDVLGLWLELMKASQALSQDLLQLYNLMPLLLEQGNESLRTCIQLIEAYLLFNSPLFEPMHAQVASALATLYDTVPQSSRILITRVLHVAVMSPSLCAELQGFLATLAQQLLFDSRDDRVRATASLSLLARVALQHPELFAALMEQASTIAQADATVEFWGVLAELYDSVTLDRWKKLLGMVAAVALCQYTASASQHLDTLLSLCTSTIYTLHFRGEAVMETDFFVVDVVDFESHSANQALRQAKMEASEPVGQYSLRSFVSKHLAQFHSMEGADKVIALVDPTVLESLNQALTTASATA
eukprot:m.115577 g.115577  ORF g.115577 m.115577 type:complete len:970 (+) comp15497_c0_seq7:103-3012(+)